MSDTLLDVIDRGVTAYDLGRPLFQGMPQSPNHPPFWHTLPRRHGDMVRSDGGSAANDMISMGTHVGTHIDALAHVSHEGKLHGGQDARQAGVGGKFMELGIHTVPPMVRRGVLLDMPLVVDGEQIPPGYEITVSDLEAEVQRSGIELRSDDVILVRSGWGARFDQGVDAYVGHQSGVPGVSEAGAQWLAEHSPVAVGADTIAFERLAPEGGHSLLPAHRVLLVEHGIYIMEALNLEQLSREQVYEFTIVIIPLNLVGATGSPVRPIALVSNGR